MTSSFWDTGLRRDVRSRWQLGYFWAIKYPWIRQIGKSCVSFLHYVLRLNFRLFSSSVSLLLLVITFFLHLPHTSRFSSSHFFIFLIIVILFLLPVLRLFLLLYLLLLFIPLVLFLYFIFFTLRFHTILLLLYYILFLLHSLPPSSRLFLSSPSFVYIPILPFNVLASILFLVIHFPLLLRCS